MGGYSAVQPLSVNSQDTLITIPIRDILQTIMLIPLVSGNLSIPLFRNSTVF